ncbi:MAG: hypothetical protein D6814_18115 [Calditrichaeota bacterium]|nr:MAG: hypothetical protein D6814_18115 [Calditrichota bacterium]
MLITFSGIVGSGKSTNAKRAYHRLKEMGYPVEYVRFRFVNLKSVLKPHSGRGAGKTGRQTPNKQNGMTSLRAHRPRKMTLVRCLGYLWRMLVFRLFVAIRLRGKIGICDRFFYDNFTHYAFTTTPEKVYLKLLKSLLPQPDLALMLVASADKIIERRKQYDPHYLARMTKNYLKVLREFPNVTMVRTDEFEGLDATIDTHIREALKNFMGQRKAQPRDYATVK